MRNAKQGNDLDYLAKLRKSDSAPFCFVLKLEQLSAANQNRHVVFSNGHLAYPHIPSVGKGYTFPAFDTGYP